MPYARKSGQKGPFPRKIGSVFQKKGFDEQRDYSAEPAAEVRLVWDAIGYLFFHYRAISSCFQTIFSFSPKVTYRHKYRWTIDNIGKLTTSVKNDKVNLYYWILRFSGISKKHPLFFLNLSIQSVSFSIEEKDLPAQNVDMFGLVRWVAYIFAGVARSQFSQHFCRVGFRPTHFFQVDWDQWQWKMSSTACQ